MRSASNSQWPHNLIGPGHFFGNKPKKPYFVHQTLSCWEVLVGWARDYLLIAQTLKWCPTWQFCSFSCKLFIVQNHISCRLHVCSNNIILQYLLVLYTDTTVLLNGLVCHPDLYLVPDEIWRRSLGIVVCIMAYGRGPLTLLESITKVPDRQVAKTGKSSIFWLSFFLSSSSSFFCQ